MDHLWLDDLSNFFLEDVREAEQGIIAGIKINIVAFVNDSPKLAENIDDTKLLARKVLKKQGM